MSYILLVDAFTSRDVIEDILKLRGYEVLSSSSVLDAKNIISEKGVPAVLLIDLFVPGGGIEEFIELLDNQGCLIIGMSELDIGDRFKLDGFLRKPFYLEEFERILKSYG